MSKIRNTEAIDLQLRVEAVSKKVVYEIRDVIAEEATAYGDEYGRELCRYILTNFVGAMVYSSLQSQMGEGRTKKETSTLTMRHFAGVKAQIQNSVSTGFAGAMSTFCGKDMEYVCQILTVGEPVNKRAC